MDYMHYQRYPHIHGDLEPAFVVRPHEPCCPDEKEECVCITSGEVERWNDAAEILSGLSGFTPEDFDKIASAAEVATSADFWNSAYNTVNTNSANWNSTYNTVCSNSATWESAGQIPEILSGMENLADAISAKSDKLYFDRDSLSGDGSKGSPISVRGWQSYINFRDALDEVYDHIITVPPADGLGERFIFDGAKIMLDSANSAIADMSAQMYIDTQNILNLSSVALAASAYAKEVADKSPEYVADERTIHRYCEEEPIASGIGNKYVFTLKALPVEYTSGIDKGIEAYNMVQELRSMGLAGFRKKVPYPTKAGDISACTALNTIYYSVEE